MLCALEAAALGSAVAITLTVAAAAAAAAEGNDVSRLRAVPASAAHGTTYLLPATADTIAMGCFDSAQPPALTIQPGDTVVMETMMVFHDGVVPGITIADLPRLRAVVPPGCSAHTLTGPIYVEGAEPGDVLKVKINKIVPRSYGVNFNPPGVGGEFPSEFPVGSMRFSYLDWDTKTAEFLPGIVIPLHPFPGTIGVARAEPGRFSTNEPGPFTGNMDLREMTAGSTLYLPVFMKGGLLWSGDSHAAQGNGEVNVTAIETAFKELNLTIDLLKARHLAWPRIETPTYWVTVGYDRDLNRALDLLQAETTEFLMQDRGLSSADAKRAMLRMWDCPVAEVVDGVKGTYCRIPKNRAARAPAPLPSAETAREYVTVGASTDLGAAMDQASLHMIDLIAKERNLSRVDAYGLASVAMDCRIAPPIEAEKHVHCLVAKSLWTRPATAR
jgi:acetamidase/formamidase